MITIHIADYVIGFLILLVPVIIGAIFAYRDANRLTREEYFLGGRSMSLLPVSLSMFITYQSAISLIGIPNEVITYGSMNIFLSIGFGLSYIIGAFTMVPLLYPLRITSVYEYLQLRYNSKFVRLMCTILGMFYTVLYMAMALLAPALALEASVGLPLWMSVIIFGAIGTLYTAVGGIKSVIWTDTFQTVIVLVGILTMIIAGVSEVGSFSEVWRIAYDNGRADLRVTGLDPRVRYTYLGTIIGGAFMWLTVTFNQSTVQRISSLETIRRANIAYLLNIPMVICYGFVLTVMGNVVYAYFTYTRCDPLQAGFISNGNQLCPYFVLETLNHLPGMVGLYVSTLCCGALSTLSSGINSLAANTVEDLLARPMSSLREGTVTFITKAIVFLFGGLIIGLAYVAKALSGPVSQITITIGSAFGTPINAIFLMGGMVPWANKYGSVVGMLFGLTFNLWASLGKQLYGRPHEKLGPIPSDQCFDIKLNESVTIPPGHAVSTLFNVSSESTTMGSDSGSDYGFFLYDMSYEWLGMFGTILTVVVGLVVSYITKSWPSSGVTTEARLILPWMRKFWRLPTNTDVQLNAVEMEFEKAKDDSNGNENYAGL